MGSNTNFKNFSDTPTVPGSLGLARQSSVYSLTFEEFQNTMGGFGKDFGSMNMDELLKSIWSAEETQILASNVGFGTGLGGVPRGNLQGQGSITLPRTLSQKTVDEVWRDVAKEGSNNSSAGVSAGPNMPQRQQTLGEITLEEFLVRAGIVREDASQAQLIGRPSSSNNNTDTNNPAFGLLNDNGAAQMNHPGLNQTPVSPLSFGGARTSQQQQKVFSKPPAGSGFAPAVHLVSNAQLASSGARQAALAGLSQPALSPAPLVRTRGVGNAGVTASPVSHLSPNVMVKAGSDSPGSLSPMPYMFNRRGKCSAALEKVIERRQKRMIKNRESASRSRARKQAYTMELEAEVAKLKEINDELQRKQEILEVQKNQILESMNQQWGSKRQCLRRTFTGPW